MWGRAREFLGRQRTNLGAAATMHIVKGQQLIMAFVRFGGKEQIGGNCVSDPMAACLAYNRIHSSVMVRNIDDDILVLARLSCERDMTPV